MTTINRLLASTLLLFLFSACAPLYPERPISIPPPVPGPQTIPTPPEPEPAPVPAPTPAPPIAGPAAPLYAKAESALQAGNFPAAEMLLQRALRIEPRNPHYWYALARTASQQGNHRQTVQFCLKAASLAGKDGQLMQRIRTLQEHAERTLKQ